MADDRMDSSPTDEAVAAGPAGIEVVDVPETRRYEVRAGSRVVGHTRYARQGDSISLLHTEIDPSMEGRGVGSRLAAAVLADVMAKGLTIVVRCPFIAAYVRRHAEDYPGVELRD